jgi:hypothetical protein
MKQIIVPLFATMLAFTATTATLPASHQVQTEGVTKYTCHLDYPDGTAGVAIVKVIISTGEEAATPTVMITVDYYGVGQKQYLGRYEDWSSNSDFPNDEYEAEQFALEHFKERW